MTQLSPYTYTTRFIIRNRPIEPIHKRPAPEPCPAVSNRHVETYAAAESLCSGNAATMSLILLQIVGVYV